jgi:hypothetical protein
MITNKEYLEEFEKQVIMAEPLDLERNLGIYEALWQEAVELGIFPLKDPFDGVEDDIHLAKMLNRLNPSRMDDDEIIV